MHFNKLTFNHSETRVLSFLKESKFYYTLGYRATYLNKLGSYGLTGSEGTNNAEHTETKNPAIWPGFFII